MHQRMPHSSACGVFAVVGLAVAGCGRKGDLDPPGSTAPINTKAASGHRRNRTRTVQDRPFLLDPLL